MRRLNPVECLEPATHIAFLTDRGMESLYLHDALAARFMLYEESLPALRRIPNTPDTITPYADRLRALYASEAADCGDIRAAIRNLEETACPFCGRPGKPATLDHFLPQSAFPEFSMYYRNLIPSCYDCNTAKKVRVWGDDDTRLWLNPYVDEFLSREFVRVNINPIGHPASYAEPLFNFEPVDLEPSQIAICISHFTDTKLGLYPLLRHQFSKRFFALRGELRREVTAGTMTVARLNQLLQDREEGARGQLGFNSWECLLYRGILADEAVKVFLATVPFIPAAPIA